MWIKESERKPDTSRRVLVRGYNHHGDAMIAMAQWSEDDKRWINIVAITVVYSAYGPEPEYWMEIDDLFFLGMADRAEPDSKIDVPVQHTILFSRGNRETKVVETVVIHVNFPIVTDNNAGEFDKLIWKKLWEVEGTGAKAGFSSWIESSHIWKEIK